jgi:hypothetical protein
MRRGWREVSMHWSTDMHMWSELPMQELRRMSLLVASLVPSLGLIAVHADGMGFTEVIGLKRLLSMKVVVGRGMLLTIQYPGVPSR